MKKLFLLLICVVLAEVSSAQLLLNGTNYTENFDGIASGVPTGWELYTNATPTSLGATTTKYTATGRKWSTTNGEFRNCASADSYAYFGSADSAQQVAEPDRSLSVRQVSYTNGNFGGSDSGAAFVLKIAHTVGLTNFDVRFKLQSLDSTSPRISTWNIDYAFGSSPTSFTALGTTGTTGGNTFTNNSIVASFGSALDNQTGPVWIRIVALKETTGGGNRTTTGVDDFVLNWTGLANGAPLVNSLQMPLNVFQTADKINVGFSIEKSATVTATVCDLTGRVIYSQPFDAAPGVNTLSLAPQLLTSGMYLVGIRNEQTTSVAKVVVNK